MDAVIVMAGKGTRLNAGINKVFLPLENRPLFTYSLAKLKKICEHIVLVINPLEEELVRPYLDEQVSVAYGSDMRYKSVYEGIKKTNSDYVLIHDGARPFFKELSIETYDFDCLMYVGSVKDTIYNQALELVDRSTLVAAKTPQIVNKKLYLEALELARKDNFVPTDEISLLLRYHKDLKVKQIMDEENFKVTTKLDYELAKVVIKNAI